MLQADQFPGRSVLVEGKEYLYFAGTSYLGMAQNSAFRTHLTKGFHQYGTNYPSSRISNFQLRIFEEAETYLATYAGAQAALTVSSGYLAGQMAIRMLQGKSSFCYAPDTHPAVRLSDSEKKAIPVAASAFSAWTTEVVQHIQASSQGEWVLVCNSVDPLNAQRYSFDWLAQLPSDRSITLVIDDSHGFGILGKDGAGIFTELPVPASVRLVVVSSLGKSFGVPGGVVLSDADFIDRLRHQPFFGASSPVIPAYLYAFLQSKNAYKQARTQLQQNIDLFRAFVVPMRIFQMFPQFPVFYTDATDLYAYLRDNGVIISSFSYPTEQDALITRVVLNSLHLRADIEKLAHLIAHFTYLQATK